MAVPSRIKRPPDDVIARIIARIHNHETADNACVAEGTNYGAMRKFRRMDPQLEALFTEALNTAQWRKRRSVPSPPKMPPGRYDERVIEAKEMMGGILQHFRIEGLPASSELSIDHGETVYFIDRSKTRCKTRGSVRISPQGAIVDAAQEAIERLMARLKVPVKITRRSAQEMAVRELRGELVDVTQRGRAYRGEDLTEERSSGPEDAPTETE